MSLSDQATGSNLEETGTTAREFLSYCKAERARRQNSGEEFESEAFDEAVEKVMRKLRLLAEEGWT